MNKKKLEGLVIKVKKKLSLCPQEQKQSEKSSPNERTFSQRVRYVLSLMTIEPMMLLQGIGTNMAIIPTDQMILYKICRGKQHLVMEIYFSDK